jgi:hypothetical protein
MNLLGKDDLSQMNRDYFQGLKKEKLVEVAANLHALAVEQLELLEKNSENSSRPPSSDSPYSPSSDSSKEIDLDVKATEGIELLDEKKLSESPSLAKEKKLLKRPPGKQALYGLLRPRTGKKGRRI